MKKLSFFAAILAVLLMSLDFTKTSDDANETFAQYCASCHGERIDAFVDRQWKHGKTKEEIIKTITSGSVENGMPAWGGTLSEKQIDNLASEIVNALKTVDQYKFTKAPKQSTFKTGSMTLSLDTIATGFDSPWGFTQLPNGEYLITDRAGTLYRIGKNKEKVAVKNTPKVWARGQGGMLDVEIHPEYAKNGWVYISYSKPKVDGKDTLSATTIVRGRIVNDEFVNQQQIFEAFPFTKTNHHYGSRIVFDGKGYIYFSVGEKGLHFENAQNTKTDLGKIHRLFEDGRIPKDNPFYGKSPNRASIWAYGNRNPQGLALNPFNGQIWENEHGPRGGDEINIIKKGANYGWPAISYGINYDGKPITSLSARAGMEQPAYYYIPSIAPSGMAFVNSSKYPDWKGNLLIGSLRFNYLERVVLNGDKVVSSNKELANVGRMRNVKLGNDGFIYISVENPGMVFRLKPE